MHTIKGFLEVHKVDVQLSLSLRVLLYYVAYGENLVSTSSSFAEVSLLLSQLLFNGVRDALNDDPDESCLGWTGE